MQKIRKNVVLDLSCYKKGVEKKDIQRCTDKRLSEINKGLSEIDKDKISYINSLPQFKQSITKLENCLIKDEENWICNSDIKHISLPIKFFGLQNGDWIIDRRYENNIKNWKFNWYLSKFECDDTCYQRSKSISLEKYQIKR